MNASNLNIGPADHRVLYEPILYPSNYTRDPVSATTIAVAMREIQLFADACNIRLIMAVEAVVWPSVGILYRSVCQLDSEYDAIIVGGGPAGLSALSGLARVRRKVLLIDSGVYRNDPTRKMHDVLGYDGVAPAYFRNAARQQIATYDTIQMVNGTVTSIVPLDKNNTSFNVTADFLNGGNQTITARKIVLATGMRDILPSTPGLSEAWGKGIYWCPWCDGHESADQSLGLLCPMDEVASMVREILTLNTDIIAFVNGTDTEEARAKADSSFPDWDIYLDVHSIKVVNTSISQITRVSGGDDSGDGSSLPSVAHHDLFNISLGDGSSTNRAAFFASFPSVQASDVGQNMGVNLLGQKLAVDEAKGMLTNLFGVYAVGDANSDNSTNVPHALYSGKRSAVFLHVQLAREDGASDIAAAKSNGTEKRSESLERREIWNLMNGSPGEPLYAGDYED
ncbi:pyridine nucleotide-disulfide oxidoreductase-like protein [Xylariales sp. PMI_506]|nr:pyridine nucleotide-disulfide oxidoreductase-like protein [Xylariales sp. PMI_506]